MTYGLDSVGDVFGSLFAFAGVLVIGSGVLPRWLGWASILAGILFFLQGFGLGSVIASFGLVLDLIAFVLFLIFVLVSSVILLTRQNALPGTAGGISASSPTLASALPAWEVERTRLTNALTCPSLMVLSGRS